MNQQPYNGNNNFTQSPGYNGGPVLRNNNDQPQYQNNNQYNYTPQNPYQAPATANKKYKWSTWFCCCTKNVTAAEFVREYHGAQVCFDTTILVLTVLGLAGRLADGAPAENDPDKDLKWAELSGQLAFGSLHAVFLAISLCYNCKASRAAVSSDPAVRAAGGFKIATILGTISSIIVTITLFAAAAFMGFVTLAIHALLRYYNADDLPTAIAVSIFASIAILILLLAIFPLCLSFHGCTNCEALAETGNMTRPDGQGDTHRGVNPPQGAYR